MLKRIFSLVITLLIAVYNVTGVQAGDYDKVNIYMNNAMVGYDGMAIVENGQSFVPLREFCEALGISVVWDNDNRCIKLFYPRDYGNDTPLEAVRCLRCDSKYHTTNEHGDGYLDAPQL